MALVNASAMGESGLRYQRISNEIRRAIDGHNYLPGEAIPAERDLAERYQVSRVTVRRAIEELVGAGVLTRKRGAGTFVAERVEKQFSKLSSFSEDMRARGRLPSSKWVSRSVGTVTPSEALSLGLSPGSPVYRFLRVRFADGQSMAFERSTIAIFALPSVSTVEDSLYDALEATGNRPVRALQKLRASLVDSETAELLGIAEGAPGLFIERRGYLADGRTVEMTESWYRGDAYDFVAELSDQ